MANQITRKQLERWLIDNGFSLKPGKKSGHKNFRGQGVTITIPGHGPADLTKKHVGIIVRQLEQAGFDREKVLQELKG